MKISYRKKKADLFAFFFFLKTVVTIDKAKKIFYSWETVIRIVNITFGIAQGWELKKKVILRKKEEVGKCTERFYCLIIKL